MMKNAKLRRLLSVLLSFAMIVTILSSMFVYSSADEVDPADPAADAVELAGEGTESAPYEIGTKAELEAMRDYVNAKDAAYVSAYYVLTDDIDLENAAWNPIGRASNGISTEVYFGGMFDGQGYTISGLSINTAGSSSRYYTAGLFGYNTGTIKNLIVEGNIHADMWNGILAGRNAGTIENCATDGNLTGAYADGGIVGINRGGTVKNSYTTANVPVYGASYANESGEPTVENTYYLDSATGDNISGVTEPMSNADFASGKVAWLLQNGQDDLVWEQEIGADNAPVLHKDDDGDCNEVRRVQFILGDTVLAEDFVNDGNTANAPKLDKVDVDGYTLGDTWYKSADKNAGEWNFGSDAVTADTSIYGEKVAVEYTITYELGEGTNDPSNPDTYTVEDLPITLKAPTNGANTFAGWTGTDITGAALLEVTIPEGSTGDRTYVAHYYDGTAPHATITIGDHNWDYSHDDVEFDLFYNSTQTVTITATDNEDAVVDEIFYYISDVELSADELAALGDDAWTAYTESFTINPEQGSLIIYAKASDDNDNVVYVNTSGIVFDITDPVIDGVTDGNTYCLTASFTVDEENLASVEADAEGVLTEADGTYTISTNGTYTITATDKAGNTSTVTITVGNHEEGLVSEVTLANPSCETPGTKITYTYCKNCSQIIKTENETLPALEHDWTEWETILMPSCEDDGTEQRTCRRCYKTETKNLDETGHEWNKNADGNEVYTVDKKATCTAPGSESIHCLKCGAQKESREIPMISHNTNIKRTENEVKPTCTTDGTYETVVYCSMCRQVQSRTPGITPATGHNYSAWETVSTPDCDDEGTMQRTCSKCGYVDTKNLAATGHTWEDDFTLDQAATCTEDGSESIKCSVCGAIKESRTINATGHTPANAPVKEVIVQATCEANGSYDMVDYCTVCRQEASREHFVEEALGHDWSDWYLIESPDCDDEGAERRDCSRCQLSETRGVAAEGHAWNVDEDGEYVYTVDLEPTCISLGSESIHCTKCTALLDSRTIDALGHDWGEWVVIESPDCDDEGTEIHTCNRCKLTETQNLNPNGHDWNEDYTIDSPATCTTDGSQSIHCKNCSATMNSEAIPATGHAFGDWETVSAPTCQDTGIQQRVCETCQYTETAALDATGNHEIPRDENGDVIYTIVEATCTTDGSKTVYCAVCGITLESEVIPSTSHDFEDDFRIDKDATCGTEGSMSRHCKNCDEVTDVTVIPATGQHTPAIVGVKAATCTKDGYTGNEVCSVCGEVLAKGKVIPATGHASVVVGAKAATCTEEGYTGDEVCSVCGELLVKGEVIPVIAHSFENGVCTVCGAKQTSPNTGSEYAVAASFLALVVAGLFVNLFAIKRRRAQ